MSVGEFLAVFASIILGIGIGDLAISLHRLLAAGKRVRWDWLSPALALFVLINIVGFWWACYGWYRSAPNLTVLGFLPDVGMFVLMVLSAAAVFPDAIQSEGIDLRQFYFDRARYFYSLQVVLLAVIILVLGPRYAKGGWLDVLGQQWDNLAICGVMLVLLLVRVYWIHAIGVAALLSYMCWSYAGFTINNQRTILTPPPAATTNQDKPKTTTEVRNQLRAAH